MGASFHLIAVMAIPASTSRLQLNLNADLDQDFGQGPDTEAADATFARYQKERLAAGLPQLPEAHPPVGPDGGECATAEGREAQNPVQACLNHESMSEHALALECSEVSANSPSANLGDAVPASAVIFLRPGSADGDVRRS